ncbi:GNAT family N-acetyltransferase [Actinomycetospora cinnamomea]|uniref:Acetyltransferase (GNAT) family protein n=1 Tax=Actinomycetospora cinnamomea TaxID=663609 RepID=A0A2U1FDD6_9PSEU|nr:GNAT family N-acetyltransferase [Actinomycetospora cinnamomea]PVZ10146.1 acetyltransferase (GNAT) family protein [Actinomycetospora cinnamomea]
MAGLVRDRRPEDLDAVASALVEVHRVDGYPVEGVDDPHAWLNPPGLLHAWVAVVGDHVVGHALTTTAQPGVAAVDAWVAHGGDPATTIVGGRLFVAPAGRGHRLGLLLARTMTDWAAHHCLDLVGDVMTKDSAAIAAYERLGWQRIGTAMHDTGHGTQVPAYLYVSPAPLH